jgi:hypothetical protein
MNDTRFQLICYRTNPDEPCAPAFSFASFLHLSSASESGRIQLQSECATGSSLILQIPMVIIILVVLVEQQCKSTCDTLHVPKAYSSASLSI